MKRLLLSLLLLALMSGCSLMSDTVKDTLTTTITNTISDRFENLDPYAVAAAASTVTTALSISNTEIVQLCQEYMAQMDETNVIMAADDPYTVRLGGIMARFKGIEKLRLNYAVYEGNVINAFASGDGSVRVYTGLMDVMNDDELFAVIGHELGHLVNHDVRDAYRTAYLVVAARYGLSAFGERAGAVATGFLGELADELANKAYSRHQEMKADEKAYEYCVQSGVDPYAMYHALNTLMDLGSTGEASNIMTNMFSDHPDTTKRAQHIKELAEKDGHILSED